MTSSSTAKAVDVEIYLRRATIWVDLLARSDAIVVVGQMVECVHLVPLSACNNIKKACFRKSRNLKDSKMINSAEENYPLNDACLHAGTTGAKRNC